MLRRLSVENYALIDKLEMELDPHLNIITGETGAGKSILLGALGLLLGAKNDGQAMKDATRNCTVEGTFDLAGSSLEAFFAENDLDYAPETTLTRMITPAGKSRAFVNDVPVQLAQLRELGARLLAERQVGAEPLRHIADRLEEKELLELRENYQRRAAERYPIAPQLSYGNGDGMPERPDGAFLI